jgi:glycosyltransferase involved in cell wall biosynthesis
MQNVSPLTILFPYDADQFGGSHVSSLILAKALAARGHRIVVVTHGEGRVTAEAESVDLEVRRLPRLMALDSALQSPRAHVGHATASWPALREIRTLQADVVHVNDLSMLRAWALPAWLARRPLVVHWRSSYSKSITIDLSLRIGSVIVAVSHYSKGLLPSWCQEKTVVEYNALPRVWTEQERIVAGRRIRERLGISTDAWLLGMFGNFTRRKRTFVLADIVDRMPTARDGRPVFALACGTPVAPVDDVFERRLADPTLADRIIRPGFVRPVEDWMAACDVILAPSEREPLARNVLEARAVGVPAIASADGGLSEVVRHREDGIILPHDDIEAWVGAIDELLSDRRFAGQIAENAREHSRTLSTGRHAERIEHIYRAAMGEDSGLVAVA